MSETVKQAIITVTFYFGSGNEPIEQLKRKYIVKNWQTEDDLRRLLDEIAAEMNYVSGYGIKSIAAEAEQLKFTIDYGNRFMPYGDYNKKHYRGFWDCLRFEVGHRQTGAGIKTIRLEIPRVDYSVNDMATIPPQYPLDNRLFQIKADPIGSRKQIRQIGTICSLSFDRKDPIFLSFCNKIYEGEILFPKIKKEWRHVNRHSLSSWWKLPEAQTTPYQRKKAEKQEKTENRKRKLLARQENQTRKLLKKHGIVAEESQPKTKPTQVYIIEQTGEHGFSTIYKIGISKSPQKRLQALTTSNPFELQIVHTFAAEPAEEAEAQLHAKYEHIHQKGEWFKLSPAELAALKRITAFREGRFIISETA